MKKNILIPLIGVAGGLLIASLATNAVLSIKISKLGSVTVENTMTADEQSVNFINDLSSLSSNIIDNCYNYDTVKDLTFTYSENFRNSDVNTHTYNKDSETVTEELFDVVSGEISSCFKVKKIDGVVTIYIETIETSNSIVYSVSDNALVKTESNTVTTEIFSYSKNGSNFQQQHSKERTLNGVEDTTFTAIHTYYNFNTEEEYKNEVSSLLSYNLNLIIAESYSAFVLILTFGHKNYYWCDDYSSMEYYLLYFADNYDVGKHNLQSYYFKETVKDNSIEENYFVKDYNDDYSTRSSLLVIEGSEFNVNTNVEGWTEEKGNYQQITPTIMTQAI